MFQLIDKFLEYFVNLVSKINGLIITKERKRELKKNIVEWAYNKLNHMPLSMKSIGITMRSFHQATPIMFIIIMALSNSQLVCLAVLFFLSFFAILFFFFDTCIISSLENRIFNDDFNIVDPVLELFSIELSFINRLKVSYFIGYFYMSSIFGIYFLRFHNKDILSFFKKRVNDTDKTIKIATKSSDITDVVTVKEKD